MLGQHFSKQTSMACHHLTSWTIVPSFNVIAFMVVEILGGGGTTPLKPFEYTERQNLRRVNIQLTFSLANLKGVRNLVCHGVFAYSGKPKMIFHQFWKAIASFLNIDWKSHWWKHYQKKNCYQVSFPFLIFFD